MFIHFLLDNSQSAIIIIINEDNVYILNNYEERKD